MAKQDLEDYAKFNDPFEAANRDAKSRSNMVQAQRAANRTWGREKQPSGDDE